MANTPTIAVPYDVTGYERASMIAAIERAGLKACGWFEADSVMICGMRFRVYR